MILHVPNEVALSPEGGDLCFDTETRKFFEPIGFDGERMPVGSLQLAKLKRLSPAAKWVRDHWPETDEKGE